VRFFLGATALQIVGLICITVAVAMIKDGWYAVGAFGVALTTVAELTHRRLPPS
jgi:hypothetical protein